MLGWLVSLTMGLLLLVPLSLAVQAGAALAGPLAGLTRRAGRRLLRMAVRRLIARARQSVSATAEPDGAVVRLRGVVESRCDLRSPASGRPTVFFRHASRGRHGGDVHAVTEARDFVLRLPDGGAVLVRLSQVEGEPPRRVPLLVEGAVEVTTQPRLAAAVGLAVHESMVRPGDEVEVAGMLTSAVAPELAASLATSPTRAAPIVRVLGPRPFAPLLLRVCATPGG